MTEHDTAPIGRDPRAGLRQLLREHGQRWEIQLVRTYWEAVTHPWPGCTVVHCAHDLAGLRAKLEAAGDE
jgi:hypothetical protein